MCMTCDVVSCTDYMDVGLHKRHVHELETTVADGHRGQLQEDVRAAEAGARWWAQCMDKYKSEGMLQWRRIRRRKPAEHCAGYFA